MDSSSSTTNELERGVCVPRWPLIVAYLPARRRIERRRAESARDARAITGYSLSRGAVCGDIGHVPWRQRSTGFRFGRAIQGAKALRRCWHWVTPSSATSSTSPRAAVGHLVAASAVGTTLGPIVGGSCRLPSARAVSSTCRLPTGFVAGTHLPHCARRSSRDPRSTVGGRVDADAAAYALVTSGGPADSPTPSQRRWCFTGVGAPAFVAISMR